MTSHSNITGIRQGVSLVNLIIDQIIKEVKNIGKGYILNTRSIKIISYVDDAVHISDNEDGLQGMLHTFYMANVTFKSKQNR